MHYFDIIPPKKKEDLVVPVARTVRSKGLFSAPHGWKKYAGKTIILLLLVGMNWAGFSAVGTVLAYYLDIEMAGGSVFAAGGLDFSLSDSGWMPVEDADDLGAGAHISRNVTILDMVASSSIPFQYIARIEQTGGDTPYCRKLNLDAKLEGTSVYIGSLLDFSFATTTFATSTSDEWQLDVSLPAGTQVPTPVFCNFDYIVDGSQAPFASSTYGFHDEEMLHMAVRSSAQEAPICFAGKLADFDFHPAESGFTLPIADGDIIDDEYNPWGLTIVGENTRRNMGVAVAFDSGHPTDGEEEFGTPNDDFGGPGKGNGGKAGKAGENSKGKQNVLIIPERLQPEGRRGEHFKGYEPDSGILYFKFDAPTFVESLRVLNNRGDTNTIRLFDVHGNVLRMLPIPDLGENGIQKIDVLTENVAEMRITMKKEAAVDDVCFGVKTDDAGTRSPIVLNEFLPNPEGKEYGHDFGRDSDKMPKGEWVELYNNSAEAVDLAGWNIRNSSNGAGNAIDIINGNTDTGTTVIAPHGWLVVYLNKAYLSNRRDTVRLYDATDVLIDAYDYGNADFCALEPTPGGENDEDGVGSCSGVPGNKSYARIPDGTGGWVDPVPTPGSENMTEFSSSIEQASFAAEGDARILGPAALEPEAAEEDFVVDVDVAEPLHLVEEVMEEEEIAAPVSVSENVHDEDTALGEQEAVLHENDSEKDMQIGRAHV